MGAAIPSVIVNASLNFPTLVMLPITGMIYAAGYAALLLALGVPTKDEIDSLRRLLAAPSGVQNV